MSEAGVAVMTATHLAGRRSALFFLMIHARLTGKAYRPEKQKTRKNLEL
jgi:hypothetical protein